jgi:hypothetical protein
LNSWYGKYSRDLAVLTILRDRSFKDGIKKMRENGFDWVCLDGSDADIMDYTFGVKLYPSFIIIDREGRIATSTCPMPSENLEAYLRTLIERSE